MYMRVYTYIYIYEYVPLSLSLFLSLLCLPLFTSFFLLGGVGVLALGSCRAFCSRLKAGKELGGGV